jgi:DNA-binding transcriptional LysR family regulator
MELRHLTTFQAVVEHGSFLRAAEALQYAQSSVTVHIQQLEMELGVQLFVRHSKRVELTEAGRVLNDEAAQILGRMQALRQTMAEFVSGEGGFARLGSIEPTASVRIAPLLVSFCARRPRVQLRLEVGGTRGISQMVADGKLDFGIVSAPPAELGLVFELLFVEAMALLVPIGHALAGADNVTAQDLVGERLLLTEQGCAYREAIERALMHHGANPYSGIEIGSTLTLKAETLLRSRLGGSTGTHATSAHPSRA